MPRTTAADIKRWARRVVVTSIAVIVVGLVAAVWLWRDRESLDAIDWPT